MNHPDRRQNPRFAMEIPLSIHALGSPELSARQATASNISVTGLCLTTDLAVAPGTPIEVSLSMPALVSGMPPRNWRCTGRVVRVEPGEQPGQRKTIGVELLHYDLAKA